MAWEPNKSVARDWPELRDQLLKVAETDQLAYRGQAEDYGAGTLFASIDRAFREAQPPLAEDMCRAIERLAIVRFWQRAPNYLPPSELVHMGDAASMLMLMRHYGGPRVSLP